MKVNHKNPFAIFDRVDFMIIKKLQRNARCSAKKIAEELNLNDRTVRKRIDRMIEMDVGRFSLILDPGRFGYSISVDIFLEIDLEREEEIVSKLLAMPQVSYLAFGQETNELSLEARYKSTEQLYEFLWKIIPGIEGVKVTKYALVPRILRNIDEWLPSEDDFAE
jgi:Lrp/AsnC family transcriptional regulator, regulator for asnA, asnC and gidA